VRTRTADLYRVNFEVQKLKPFACLAFPSLDSLRKLPKRGSFGDELVTSFSKETRMWIERESVGHTGRVKHQSAVSSPVGHQRNNWRPDAEGQTIFLLRYRRPAVAHSPAL